MEEVFAQPDNLILGEAARLVYGDRERDYAHPSDDFGRTAGMLNALLGAKLHAPLVAADIALIMVCVKLSREAHLHKMDNLVDAAGYLECAARVHEDKVVAR